MRTNSQVRIMCLALLLAPALGRLATAADWSAATSAVSPAVKLMPNSGELTNFKSFEMEGHAIRVTFATAMVDVDKVKRGGQPSPIVFDPVVECRWQWLTQSEGEITFPIVFADDQSWSARMGKVLHRA